MADNFTLVIDAGHGGRDCGALGTHSYEKNINLAVANLLGEMVKREMKDVKVVYTRPDDKFVSLNDRAVIANKAHGDLFVSIHVNSVSESSKNRNTVKGASVYTLGLNRSSSNLEVAKRENSVITLENDYSIKYQGFDPNSAESYIIFELNQNKHMEQSVEFACAVKDALVAQAGRSDMGVRQDSFWVLWATGMPSVLVELDFICNPEVEEYLVSDEGQEQMASAIFSAFKDYKSQYDRRRSIASASVKPTSKERKEVEREAKRRSEAKAADTYADNSRHKGEPCNHAVSGVNSQDSAEDNHTSAMANSAPVYRVQFLVHKSKLSDGSRYFKGLSPVWSYQDRGIWKYTVGEAATWREAESVLSEVKKEFPDAFIIKTVGNQRL